MIREMLKEIKESVKGIKEESEDLSPLQKAYQSYFNCWLKKYGVKSPADLDKETMSKFFNDINDHWDNGKGASKNYPCK